MTETKREARVRLRADEWRKQIAEQERSGSSVAEFCRGRGLTLWSFYSWRKRLRESEPVRFALVEHAAEPQEGASGADIEVVFMRGERLRIRSGVDKATLRTVLEVLRG